jgi:hypothetical protein
MNMVLNTSEMSCFTTQDNQTSADGHISFTDSIPHAEITRIVAARPVPDEFYRARLNDFTSDILGELADRWIKLFEPQPDYRGNNLVWWPETITMMSPRLMVKHGKIYVTLPTFKADLEKIESCFFNNCYVGN